MHAHKDGDPGQRAKHRQQAKAPAPAIVLHQPGQRRAGKEQAQTADAHADAGHEGKAVAGEMTRDEHGAGQKGGRTADADQQLAQHQAVVTGGQRRDQRAGNRQRKGRQHGLAQAIQVHAHAHEKLRHPEGQTKQPGKRAQRLGRQPEIGAQPVGNDGGDGAEGLAQREGRQQGQQHGPEQRGRGRRRAPGGGGCRWDRHG